MSLSDYYLQKKIQGGDIREFERLFQKYYESLCRHSFLILKDMDMAEDIVQEFFYNLWKNRSSISIKLSMKAYMFQSIRNNSLHYLEHLAVKLQYATEVGNERVDYLVLEDAGMSLDELNKTIEETLSLMPERVSLIFRLNRFEGKKYKEIAEMLSISIKTVEADMGKALQIFRKSLKDFNNYAS
jgi:RNA polymerase sigma-70 factor, ECF subfamily